jgi:small ligand-binding sensory domain FIST
MPVLVADLTHSTREQKGTEDPALAGMFCAGELGPVGGRNAVHGFTASIAIFT